MLALVSDWIKRFEDSLSASMEICQNRHALVSSADKPVTALTGVRIVGSDAKRRAKSGE